MKTIQIHVEWFHIYVVIKLMTALVLSKIEMRYPGSKRLQSFVRNLIWNPELGLLRFVFAFGNISPQAAFFGSGKVPPRPDVMCSRCQDTGYLSAKSAAIAKLPKIPCPCCYQHDGSIYQ